MSALPQAKAQRNEGMIMKKIAIGLVTYMLLLSSAYACTTQTIIVGGKVTTCTVCGQVVSCI
jgi:hypothetical protein